MTEVASAHLTTSRVNRLLRPLRNKCNSLAALPGPKSATASRVTYSKQSAGWDSDSMSRTPLTVLCGPTKRLTLEKCSADEIELSRRIYAVCDAFKNIAHVAYGQPCDQRIPSLAAVCALVIGENMPATESDGPSADSCEEASDEDDELEVLDVDGIYEAVPSHYRRFLIVSHALSMILCMCTHHHTLVTVLLDHCLTFGLVHESTHLLNIIIAQAFLPSNLSHRPPVTHPAHGNYLLDLHTKWTTGNKPPGPLSGRLLFTTSAFCQVVLGALSKSSPCNSPILWTSKVLDRLFHVVESSNLDSYMDIINTLSRSFWEMSDSTLDAVGDEARLVVLRDKLSELMSNLFDLLFGRGDSHPSPLTPSIICTVIDILYECHTAQLRHPRMPTSSSNDLPDIIIILSTHIFVAFRNLICNFDHLLSILDDSSPIPTTFSKLMKYFSRLKNTQTFVDFAETFLAQLKTYSASLRSENLFKLDASLWACALRHFEMSVTGSQKCSSTLIPKYKQQFMEAVDAAERRCFGDAGNSPIAPLSICSNRAKRMKRGRLSGHWEWEDMVGSWIRRTPVHKKQKVDDGRLHGPRGTLASKATSGSISVSAPLSIGCRRLTALSPTSPQSSESDGSDYRDETDKENYPSSPPQVAKRRNYPIKRRSSNFSSLLADAQTNRIVLHTKPRPKLKPPSSVIPEKHILPLSASRESQHAPRKQEPKASCGRASSRRQSRTLLPSDDSLDLFAYAISSPARC